MGVFTCSLCEKLLGANAEALINNCFFVFYNLVGAVDLSLTDFQS